MIKCKRGQKICSQCQTINGVRSFVCKNCGYEFTMKKKRKGRQRIYVEDYRTLKPGDMVKVVGNSGDYYLASDGTKCFLTDRGKYRVVKIDKEGFVAFGGKRGRVGFTFIYMGKKRHSTVFDRIIRKPHKLLFLGQ